MKYGFYTPNFDFFGDATVLAELAAEAEVAGWDGFFIWDHLQFIEPVADPWIALTAMALRTKSIRLGPLVTPVPRRHIGKLAREVLTLDRLSNGRLTLGVGAGYPHLPDYVSFGDSGDQRDRAARFDEALGLLDELCSGKPVQHNGAHYRVETGAFASGIQRPRVPIWVAATWPAKRPLVRAARWDGIVASGAYGLEVEPAAIAEIAAHVRRERPDEPVDILRFGRTENPSDTSVVGACAAAGATWWIEYAPPAGSSLAEVRSRIALGPPRI
ncbi:LLM class flavin-dependent oxidoreductase [Aldersonia kunmingensis]|uniref:LLM class flavin-dependent oxidoreductase n=1 Tax=Aldersonia kunmingensis TaxID=408066 RepID=UPI000836B145|nr:LLM class flavin-dependent oxidoreductase [Aldersonia kunmingensis]